MSKEINNTILVNRIEPYLDRFDKFFKLGHIKLSQKELEDIGELVSTIDPKRKLNFSVNCNSCIKDAIVILSNYHKRESSRLSKEMEEVDTTYYEGLDKRTKEYKDWAKFNVVQDDTAEDIDLDK